LIDLPIPIRSSDTDSIFRLYRTIQSVDAKFRFLNRPIVSFRLEFRFFNRPILFFGLKFRFLYRLIVSVRFEFRFLNRLILFFGFKFRFLYRAIVSASFKQQNKCRKNGGKRDGRPFQDGFCGDCKIAICEILQF
jgi:hypothetical protein